MLVANTSGSQEDRRATRGGDHGNPFGGCFIAEDRSDLRVNHLDLPSIERLEAALVDFPGALVVVTHDPHFARALTDVRWTLDGGRLDVTWGG